MVKKFTRCISLGVWPPGPDLRVIDRRETEDVKGTV